MEELFFLQMIQNAQESHNEHILCKLIFPFYIYHCDITLSARSVIGTQKHTFKDDNVNAGRRRML